jgi:crotonobetainyl-CoA hydratase
MDLGLNEEQRAIVETEGMSVRDGRRVLGESALPAYRAMLDSQDAREGALAFAERRKPVWRGR